MQTDDGVVGTDVPRLDAVAKLKGTAVFGADRELQNPLVLRLFRSTKPHSHIRKLNLHRARQTAGVVGVFRAEDVPGKNSIGIINKDQPLLVPDKVRCVGDPIALVAAENEAAAHRALQAIEIQYEELSALYSPADALAPGAARIHPGGNLLVQRTIAHGDVEKGFADSAVVVEKTYRTARVEHLCLEPDAATGHMDADGVLVVTTSTQNPHYDQMEIIRLLGLGDDRVRVVQSVTGGGFGSKLDLNLAGFVALALFHLQRPVRLVYSREEVFAATAKRHPLEMRVKTGADAKGRLKAMQIDITCDTGAYGSYGMAVASRAAVHATGPYAVENVRIASRCVYTNTPFSGAMRGFGAPQVAFAHESQMDLVARALGIDPLELRRRNALRPGAVTATGQVLKHSVGIGECLERVGPHYRAALEDWKSQSPSGFKKRGVGLGAMWYGCGNTGVQNPSTARIKMDAGGEVTLYTGCADIGQGSTTVLAQIAAQLLGLDPAGIRMVVADTQLTTNAGATSASRQTYISGNAVFEAATRLAQVLLTQGGDLLKMPKSMLVLESGGVQALDDPERRVSLAQLARRAARKGIALEWSGYFDPETVPLDPDNGQGAPYATYAYACQLALVTVDVLTGEVDVERVVAAHDVGRAIHPANVKGQISGGVAMGLGFALMESYRPGPDVSLKDYHVPTCGDMPEIVPIIVENPEPTGPFGAKGVGEPALVATAPAIVNALADALGDRIYRLPANLESVLAASVAGGHFRAQEQHPG